MTPKEAIQELKDASDSEVRYGDTEHHYDEVMKRVEALDMAIKALEQQPCEDVEVIQVSKGALKSRQGRFVVYDVDWLKEHFYTTEEKLYGQPKQPCEDCISRNLMIEVFEQELKYQETEVVHCGSNYKELEGIEKTLKWCIDKLKSCPKVNKWIPVSESLPSVTPKQKVGKWIKTYEPNDAEPFILWKCVSCGLSERIKTHYCPNCGAKMEVDE